MTVLGHLSREPLIVAIAGPNGAGKTTFFHSQLGLTPYRFVNADSLAREFNVDPYVAAQLANQLRHELVKRRESFVFETVFSDPVGDKLQFLKDAESAGYTVVLCFIGLNSADDSSDRVAMRVSQGGHDVPEDKLVTRFPRTLENLRNAVRELSHVLIFDNTDLTRTFRKVCVFEQGRRVFAEEPLPVWLRDLLDS
jgi:predicted ABC-type ATPase